MTLLRTQERPVGLGRAGPSGGGRARPRDRRGRLGPGGGVTVPPRAARPSSGGPQYLERLGALVLALAQPRDAGPDPRRLRADDSRDGRAADPAAAAAAASTPPSTRLGAGHRLRDLADRARPARRARGPRPATASCGSGSHRRAADGRRRRRGGASTCGSRCATSTPGCAAPGASRASAPGSTARPSCASTCSSATASCARSARWTCRRRGSARSPARSSEAPRFDQR